MEVNMPRERACFQWVCLPETFTKTNPSSLLQVLTLKILFSNLFAKYIWQILPVLNFWQFVLLLQ